MQTLGYSGERTGAMSAPSWLERSTWLDKLPLTLVCGLLLGFSTAGYGLWWLSWFGLVPLILLVFGSRSKTEAALTGLLFGLAYYLVALRWFWDLVPLDWFGFKSAIGWLAAGQLWFVESLHEALLTCLFALFVFSLPMRAGWTPHYERPRFPMLISIPLIWMFLQWVIAPSPLFLGLPIAQLAYSQSAVPQIAQMAQLGGAPLVDFVLLLSNCVLAAFIMELTNVTRKLVSRADAVSDEMGAVLDVVLVGVIIYLLVSWGQSQFLRAAAMPPYWQNPQPAAPGKPAAPLTADQKARYAPAVPVAIVQGDIPVESQQLSGSQVAGIYGTLSKGLGAPLVVLPADVLGGENKGAEPLRAVLPQLAKAEKKDFLVGSRENVENGVADTVRLYSPIFGNNQMYQKYRLVPFAEYTPLGPIGWFVPPSLRAKLTGGKEHVGASNVSVMQSMFGGIGCSISAELIYPNLIAQEVNQGAALLVNVSNLSYFHRSMLDQQLLAAAIMRAIENQRYFVLSGNTGFSAVIDPHGIVTSLSLQGKRGVLFDRVQFLTRRTPFTRMCFWREAAVDALTLKGSAKNAR